MRPPAALRRVRTRDHVVGAEHYLNAVYWGHGIYGVAGAAAAYFGKSPADLDLNEAATLAGMLPGPEHRTPFHSPAAGNRGDGHAGLL